MSATTIALAALTILVWPTPAVRQSRTSSARAAFERLAGLAGYWSFRDSLEAGTADRPVVVQGVVSYELVSNRTTVQERVHGPDHGTANMMSMIRLDGNRLVLDHYCSSGTQPRLVSQGLEGATIRFEFASATGLASPATGHIHGATFTFLPDGGFESRWTWSEPGNTHTGVRRHYYLGPPARDAGPRRD
jgi:hypothetical protein